VSVTLCRTPTQALLAAKAGAWSVSPIIHWCEVSKPNDLGLVCQIVRMLRVYEYETQVFLPNVRDPSYLDDIALMGNHVCSMPFGILKQVLTPHMMNNGDFPL
ncbi:MAG: transaldolase family protein, partial [Nitrospirales bacterium]|nr:transaldolase family protein [Nitrospirales bacterium]